MYKDINLGYHPSSRCLIGSAGNPWLWVLWEPNTYEMLWAQVQKLAAAGDIRLEGNKFEFLITQPAGPEYRGKAFCDERALAEHIAVNAWDSDFIEVAERLVDPGLLWLLKQQSATRFAA